MAQDTQLLNILVSKGVIAPEDVGRAINTASSRGITLEEVLIDRGVSEDEITDAKAGNIGVPAKHLKGKKTAIDVLRYIPEESAKHYKMVPLGVQEGFYRAAPGRG